MISIQQCIAIRREIIAHDKRIAIRREIIVHDKRMAIRREILTHDQDYLAAIYDKHTKKFQTVITKVQTFSIYDI